MTIRTVSWSKLDEAGRRAALARPREDSEDIRERVDEIIAAVRASGDAALRRFTERYDGVSLGALRVSPAEWSEADARVDAKTHEALLAAIANVRRFHEAQRFSAARVETAPGVVCERVQIPLAAVGLYVPAGSAPLPSTAIMCAVPAAIMGCPVRILCSPPGRDGRLDPHVLHAARLCGITDAFKVGGAQAIAAMAYGTESVSKVDKIFGPGNAWVTAAKLAVARDPDGAAIDMPAGPSEVMVVADESARPAFVAADLLAQAEHDPRAHVVLVSTSARLLREADLELDRQLAALPRRRIAEAALERSVAIEVDELKTAFEVANLYAPEHLVVDVADARRFLPLVRTAGSVFLGPWTCEPLGDYCSGTNHVLPTYGYARALSGLSVEDFGRRMTVQEVSTEGLRHIGPTAEVLATLEGLEAHARAVRVRLSALDEGGRRP